MPIQKIDKIRVSGFPESQAFGGYIYGLNLNVGFASRPSGLTLNIVNESGNYNISESSLSTISPYVIQIGNQIKVSAYLVGASISESSGQRVLNTTFEDRSVVLDKIFVGLTNRHLAVPRTLKPFDITVACNSCEKPGDSIVKSATIRRHGAEARIASFDLSNGGSIIVGREEFTENRCGVPDVKYNFGDLLTAMGGGLPSSITDPNPEYRQTYTGTLREVLNNWCSDFGLTFYWDLFTDRLVFVDLSKGFPNIPNLGNNPIIKRQETEFSLDGTYSQYYQSSYLKDAETKNFSSTRYERITLRPFDIKDIIKQSGEEEDYGGKRNKKDFLESCLLSYYNDSLRKLFNFYIAADSLPSEVLGISKVFEISDEDTTSFIEKYALNFSTFVDLKGKYPNGQFLICQYDENLEHGWTSLESEIASGFVGKFYRGPGNEQRQSRVCQERYSANRTVEFTPGGEIYNSENKDNLPFADLVQNPAGVVELPPGRFFMHSRDGTMSHTQAEFDELILGEDEEDLIAPHLPHQLPITGVLKAKLVQEFDFTSDELDGLTLFFVPALEDILEYVDITLAGLQRGTNKKEGDPPKEADSSGSSKECKFPCDRDITDEICEAQCSLHGDSSPPNEGLVNKQAWGAPIYIGNDGDIFFLPGDANYTGFKTITRTINWVIPQQERILGGIGPAGNTKEIKVTNNDITNDYDNMADPQEGVIEIMTPDGQIKTIEQYHNDLSVRTVNSNFKPKRMVRYTVAGVDIPTVASIQNGLQSISSNYGTEGVTTTYEFATSPPELPTPEATFQKARFATNRNYNRGIR